MVFSSVIDKLSMRHRFSVAVSGPGIDLSNEEYGHQKHAQEDLSHIYFLLFLFYIIKIIIRIFG